jgi:hypothetical protein
VARRGREESWQRRMRMRLGFPLGCLELYYLAAHML